jgi:LPS-assembly protein
MWVRDAVRVRFALAFVACAFAVQAQEATPSVPVRTDIPAKDEIRISGLPSHTQDMEGSTFHGRGGITIETAEMLLKADEIDYDQDTDKAEARGHVYYVSFERHEILEADRVDYNLADQTGTFYNVKGQAPAKIESRPGVLTTLNPYSFTCAWAEREQDRYICHNGTATNCKMPNPWWVIRGPKFDIIPDDRAISRNAWFWLKGIPVFYSPYFYRSLKRMPRRSGFLLPNIGNSSRYGKILGLGYYWAISRSMDAMYRFQWFSDRGLAHHIDWRGKPTQKSDFDFIFYGVNDLYGAPGTDPPVKQGGYQMTFTGRVDLGKDWTSRAEINYLSSFVFRQTFTQSFFEAIYSQVNSVAYVNKNWSTFSFAGVYQQNEDFPTNVDSDKISIRKLPSVEFGSRDREISNVALPLWVSFDSSFGLLRRTEPAFQTRQFMPRVDFAPRITTSFHWKDVYLTPYAGVRFTDYASSFNQSPEYNPGFMVTGENFFRNSQEYGAHLELPAIGRVFKGKGWFGPQLKHVIETHADYQVVHGINNFLDIIRFDERDILTNTNQLSIGVTNRFYRKDKNGNINEFLTWDLTQQRYFDPTFGNSIVDGQRNMIEASAELTGFAFIDQPRNYSPLASFLKFNPIWTLNVEWRTDYDPLQHRFLDSTVQMNAHIQKVDIWLAHNQVDLPWVKANQVSGRIGIGQDNRRGWSVAFQGNYDYRVHTLQYAFTQVSYNTDCCGFAAQYRRFNFGTRQENQWRVAFAVANVGTFGTLKRQERIF